MKATADSKKKPYKPHLKKCRRTPPKQNAVFVAAMEAVLAVYHRTYNEQKPAICMDEQPVQLAVEKRVGIGATDMAEWGV